MSRPPSISTLFQIARKNGAKGQPFVRSQIRGTRSSTVDADRGYRKMALRT